MSNIRFVIKRMAISVSLTMMLFSLPVAAETIYGVSRGKSDGGYVRKYALLHGGVKNAPNADVSGLEYGESRQGTISYNDYGFAVYYNAYAEGLGIWVNKNTSYNRYKSYFMTAKMDQYGNKSADTPSLTDEATFLRGNLMTGSEFYFVSDDYWFYLEKTEYPERIYFHNESKMTINISTECLSSKEPTITIYRINRSIPMTSRTDEYCSIKFRANVPCDGVTQRNVIVKYNGQQVGEQQTGVIFPNRTMETSDLQVTAKNGYIYDHTEISGNTYIVYMKPTTYTVVFDGNGNDGGSMGNQSFNFDESKKLSANQFTKTGHKFDSWNTLSNGNGTKYTDQQTVSKLSAIDGGKVTLYAQWLEVFYKVTGTIDNGGSVTNSEQTVSGDSKNAPMVFTPADGYKISGVSVNGTALSSGWSDSSYTFEQKITSDTKVVVSTSRITYNLTFDANRGTVSTTSLSYNIDSAINLPTPTRPGYKFNGWKVTSAEGNWTKDQVYTVSSIAKGKYGNVTLTAQWEAGTSDFSVSVSGLSEEDDNVVFRIEGVSDNVLGRIFTIALDGSKTSMTFKGLPTGEYKVTALAWSQTSDVRSAVNTSDTFEQHDSGGYDFKFIATPKSSPRPHAESSKNNVF